MWDHINLTFPDWLRSLRDPFGRRHGEEAEGFGRDATAIDFLEIAEDVLESGDASAALGYCTKAVEAANTRKQRHQRACALATRGSLHLRLGNQQAALTDLDEALKINKSDAVSLMNRANAYAMLGDFARARKDIRKAIDIEPKNSKAHQIQGRVLSQLGKFRPAIKSLTRAIRLEPENAENYIARGLAQQKRNKHKQAVKDFTRALELSPAASHAHRYRADSYQALNDQKAALEDQREATRRSQEKADEPKATAVTVADVHDIAHAASRRAH